MAGTMKRGTVVAAFEDQQHAQDAIRELKNRGFSDDQVGLITHRRDEEGRMTDTAEASYAAEGAMTGLAAGAGVGALWGLGIAAGLLPAIGPVIAGGTLASILASAATGAAVAGIGGALVGMGIPEDEAEYYETEFKSGRTLVTVQAGNRTDEVSMILRGHGGYDIQNKDSYKTSDEYRQKMSASSASRAAQGRPLDPTYAPPSPAAAASQSPRHSTSTAGNRSSAGTQDDATIQLHEEKLNVQKDQRQTGEVRARKEVVTEHRSIDVPVEREEVVIERHAPTSPHSSGTIQPGEEVRIPVKEEHVRVEKTPVVKEEVTIGKRTTHETKRVDADLKKEELKIDEEGQTRTRKGS